METNFAWAGLVAPLALLLVARSPARRDGSVDTRAPIAAAVLAFAALLIAAVTVWAHGPAHTGLLGTAGIGFDLWLDRLSVTMASLVSFIGVIVMRYSATYLAGDAGHSRFLRLLCGTLGSVLLLIVCGNLATLILAWIGTTWGLNRLLVFYPERRAARLAARKEAIFSRLSDLALLLGAACIYRAFGSLDYAAIFPVAREVSAGTAGAFVGYAAFALVIAALFRSAMFPVHGWLLEVMETPTPVSALLHAGIINAGGFVVLRFSHLITLSAASLDTLAIVGALTALFGSIVMLTQTSVKLGFAYSTIAQMGFMMLECGLGAFPAALLHIVAHSLYKAHAFLSSGSIIDLARASWTRSPGGNAHPARLAAAIVAVFGVTLAISHVAGASLVEHPGVFALGAVLAFGIIHLLALGIDDRPSPYVLVRVVGLATLVSASYFGLQWGVERLMFDTFPLARAARGPLDLAIVGFVVVAFAAITFFQSVLPTVTSTRWHAPYALVANGFYVNTLLNRILGARA